MANNKQRRYNTHPNVHMASSAPLPLFTWGGYCRFKSLLGATDMHGVCRFCLLASSHHDAVSRLTKAGILDFSFLTRSLSAVEISVTNNRHGILNSPDVLIQVFVASPIDCYTTPCAYILLTTVLVSAPALNPISTPTLNPISTPISASTLTQTTLRVRGFLERLLPSFRDLLNKPGDKRDV